MKSLNLLEVSRGLLSISLFFSALASSQTAQAIEAATSTETNKPNVVLIYIDDLGYGDIGSYGCKDIPTPNIDQLATEGVRCTASYITNPPCCPSRCSLMMGQYGQRFGKYGMSRGLPIPSDRPTIANFLHGEGYATGQIGKWDIGTREQGPLVSGFTEVARNPPRKTYTKKEIADLPPTLAAAVKRKGRKSKYFCVNKSGETMWLTDYDGDMMTEFVDTHKDEPFFLYWSPEAVHSPSIESPESLMKRTTAKGKRRKLAGAIVSVDDQIGKLIKALEKNNLREKTLLIFSSDNGANGGEGGSSAPYAGGKGLGTQKEGWVRVPTIFSMPGTLPEGKQFDGLIANFDFYATAASLVGANKPDHCDGVDLIPYLRGDDTSDPHEFLFWLNNEPGDAERRHLIATRWKDWRLYKKYEKDAWQLFNLVSDPREENNVADEHPQIVRKMAAQHADWKKTLAPLGQIPETSDRLKIIPTGHGWATSTMVSEN
ncbi:sulfatase-like hydrolase/transferase [bacterium]|nr:sulfatase-like hydrolase/transferase [bacterium]